MIDYNIKEFRHRFREAINALTDDWPDMEIVDDWFDNEAGGGYKLQDFCATNATYYWMTGIGIIEAAMLLVEGAAENANIDEEGRVAL